jgi:glycosyltransferase involved in cell wall biosynthesis
VDRRPLVVDTVIPARDAAATLTDVLEALPVKRLRSVVVVDNGSHDATSQIARDAGAVVLRAPSGGYGAACLAAIEHLSRLPQAPDVVAFVPADGSFEAAELPRLLAPLEAGGAELVIGVRERRRRVGDKVVLGLIETIYRHRFHDLGPMRAIRFPALIALGMSDRGGGWDVEMQVRGLKLGLGIAEVPVARGRRRARRLRNPTTLAADAAAARGRSLFHILRHATVR